MESQSRFYTKNGPSPILDRKFIGEKSHYSSDKETSSTLGLNIPTLNFGSPKVTSQKYVEYSQSKTRNLMDRSGPASRQNESPLAAFLKSKELGLQGSKPEQSKPLIKSTSSIDVKRTPRLYKIVSPDLSSSPSYMRSSKSFKITTSTTPDSQRLRINLPDSGSDGSNNSPVATPLVGPASKSSIISEDSVFATSSSIFATNFPSTFSQFRESGGLSVPKKSKTPQNSGNVDNTSRIIETKRPELTIVMDTPRQDGIECQSIHESIAYSLAGESKTDLENLKDSDQTLQYSASLVNKGSRLIINMKDPLSPNRRENEYLSTEDTPYSSKRKIMLPVPSIGNVDSASPAQNGSLNKLDTGRSSFILDKTQFEDFMNEDSSGSNQSPIIIRKKGIKLNASQDSIATEYLSESITQSQHSNRSRRPFMIKKLDLGSSTRDIAAIESAISELDKTITERNGDICIELEIENVLKKYNLERSYYDNYIYQKVESNRSPLIPPEDVGPIDQSLELKKFDREFGNAIQRKTRKSLFSKCKEDRIKSRILNQERKIPRDSINTSELSHHNRIPTPTKDDNRSKISVPSSVSLRKQDIAEKIYQKNQQKSSLNPSQILPDNQFLIPQTPRDNPETDNKRISSLTTIYNGEKGHQAMESQQNIDLDGSFLDMMNSNESKKEISSHHALNSSLSIAHLIDNQPIAASIKSLMRTESDVDHRKRPPMSPVKPFKIPLHTDIGKKPPVPHNALHLQLKNHKSNSSSKKQSQAHLSYDYDTSKDKDSFRKKSFDVDDLKTQRSDFTWTDDEDASPKSSYQVASNVESSQISDATIDTKYESLISKNNNTGNCTVNSSHHGRSHSMLDVMYSGLLKPVQLLGRGSEASVFLVKLSTGESAAVKKYEVMKNDVKNKETFQKLKKEFKMLQNLDHSNIIQYIALYKPKRQPVVNCVEYGIIMEYMEGGPLENYIDSASSQISLDNKKSLIKQILEGLSFLHSKNIIHRDLKPANILLSMDKKTAKIGDFGISAQGKTSSNAFQSCVGTPCFMAPEVLNEEGYSLKADIWSAGCCFFHLMTGKKPYDCSNGFQALQMMKNNSPFDVCDEDTLQKINSFENLRNFLDLCLNQDKSLRVSANELLKHPFLKDVQDVSNDGAFLITAIK